MATTRRKPAAKAAPPKVRTPRGKAPPDAAQKPPSADDEPGNAGLLDIDAMTPLQRAALMVSPESSELVLDVSNSTVEQEWIRQQGWTPLEFLVHTYRNPYVRMTERVASARAVLDYAHKRIPTAIGFGQDPSMPSLVPAGTRMDLSKLTTQELDVFAKLLGKANAGDGDGKPTT